MPMHIGFFHVIGLFVMNHPLNLLSISDAVQGQSILRYTEKAMSENGSTWLSERVSNQFRG